MRRVIPLLILLSLLAACAPQANPAPPAGVTPGTGPTPDASGEQVTISFAAWDYERQIYEPLAAKFGEENPNVRVVIVSLDDIVNVREDEGSMDPLATLRRIVSGADTAPSMFVPPEAYGSTLLLDLKPLMDADAAFQRDDFFPGALERVTVNDGIWTLPRYFYVQLYAYNKDLLQGAGIPAPQADWTWDDVLAIAQQAAQKTGSTVDTYGYLDQSGGFQALATLLKKQGLDLGSTPAREVTLDTPEMADNFQQVRDLIESGALFTPGMTPDGPPVDVQQVVAEGRVAIWPEQSVMMYDGPTGQPQQPTYSFEVGKLPYPRGDLFFGGVGSDGFIVSSGTEHPDEAWKWVEFLSRQQTDMTPGGIAESTIFNPPGRIPARKSIAEQFGAFEGLDEATIQAYQAALTQTPPPPARTPDWMAIGALQNALSQYVVDKRADAGRLLAEAQQQLEEQLAAVELTPTPEPDTRPVIVATPEPQEAPPGAVTVSFSSFGYNPSDLRRIARAFREERPDIFVQIRSTDTFTDVVDLPRLAQTADCFAWGQPPQRDADAAALLDLQPLFDADANFPQSDFPAALLEPYRRNGGLYGMPLSVSLRHLAYNRGAFEAAGIAAPRYDWEPADLLAAAQAITEGAGDTKRYGFVSVGGIQDIFYFVGQFGGRLTTGSGKDLRATFTDPKSVEALQWYLDLDKVHEVMPPIVLNYKRDDPGRPDMSYEIIQSGRAGMWFDQGYGFIGKPADIGGPGPSFEVGLAPLPIGGGGLRSGDFYSQALYISANAAQPEACWEFMKYITADVTTLQYSGGIPARTSVVNSPEYAQVAQPELLELHKAYEQALQRPGQPGDSLNDVYGGSLDLYWLFQALDRALTGEASLEQGLADAQEKTNTFMECVAGGETPPICALQADPAYNGYNVDVPPDIGIPRG